MVEVTKNKWSDVMLSFMMSKNLVHNLKKPLHFFVTP